MNFGNIRALLCHEIPKFCVCFIFLRKSFVVQQQAMDYSKENSFKHQTAFK